MFGLVAGVRGPGGGVDCCLFSGPITSDPWARLPVPNGRARYWLGEGALKGAYDLLLPPPAAATVPLLLLLASSGAGKKAGIARQAPAGESAAHPCSYMYSQAGTPTQAAKVAARF